MATYSLTAITIGSFALGEADKILTLFSAERGIVRAVAKGARKPGTKSSGRSDVLGVNRLLLAKGKSLDIITQSEGMESFRPLRNDLQRLTYSLYYAELAQHFGTGLEQESEKFFEFLLCSLRAQSDGVAEASILCLEFELRLLQQLGYQPEIDACVICRNALTEYLLATFNFDQAALSVNVAFRISDVWFATANQLRSGSGRWVAGRQIGDHAAAAVVASASRKACAMRLTPGPVPSGFPCKYRCLCRRGRKGSR